MRSRSACRGRRMRAARAGWGVVVLLALGYGVTICAAQSVFQYDLSRFREIDPALVGYREVEPIPLPAGAYTALAAGEDGGMAVAGASELVLLDASGAVRVRRPLEAAASCVAIGPGGTVYVGQSDHIAVFGADGSPAADWMALGEQAILTSVAAAGEWVVVADAGQHRVFVFDVSGRLVRQWDGTESGSTVGFVIPSPYFDVAAGPDGSFWVVNPGQLQLVQYDASGRVGAMWGQSGMAVERFCGCCNPVHIAVLPDGALVTAEKGIARLKVYGADGTFRAVVAGPNQFAGDQAGDDVAVDGRTGRIRVLDAAKHRVRVFEALTEAEVQP